MHRKLDRTYQTTPTQHEASAVERHVECIEVTGFPKVEFRDVDCL